MTFALDLNPRQTTRTLEQALRYRTVVAITPLAGGDDETIVCRLEAIEQSKAAKRLCLVLAPLIGNDHQAVDTNIQHYINLIGVYCEGMLQLGESRYYFSNDIVGTNDHATNGEVRLYVARPDTLQVAQRRKFWRFKPAQSSQVQVDWTGPDGKTDSGIGWLCNVSADGLACRTTTQIADQLGIGERLSLSFALGPGEPKLFRLEAVLCNKTPAGSKNTTILGMQFLTGAEHPQSDEDAGRLKQHLLSVSVTPARSPEGERS